MRRTQKAGFVLGLSLVAALTILRGSDPQILRATRDATFDLYQRWSPRTFQDMPVRVIDIDESSLRQFGQWPWPRDRLAMLVDRLVEIGVAAIAFDILLAEPDRLSPHNVIQAVPGVDPDLIQRLPNNDRIFSAAIAGQPVVLGFGLSNERGYLPAMKAGIAFTGENLIAAPPHIAGSTPLRPEFEANAAGIGHISLNPSNRTAVVRAVPLFLSDGTQLYPNLAMEALRVAQGASTYLLIGAPDTVNTITSVKIGSLLVPTTRIGELWLYVTPDTAQRYVSAGKVLASGGVPEDVRTALEGSIVFVGTSAAGLQDIRATALGENVPGVSLHAQMVEQILSSRFLWRPDWADGLEILFIALMGSLLVVLTISVSPIIALVAGLSLTAWAFLVSWFAFSYAGVLFDPLAPIVAGSITHFAATSFRFLVTDRDRRVIRRAFGQYLSPSLLYRVEHTRDALRLGGDERELTVMFVDVRNFTELSERLAPTAVVSFLNTLLDALSRHVTANEGTLDKFIGDSIMAFWNAPLDVQDHPCKAVRAALAMRETLLQLNEENAFGFGTEHKVAIGIGIHVGVACVGNMGSEARFNYSAVGDAVNVAARIEAACKLVGFDILVSADTARTIPDFALLNAGALPLRGKVGRTSLRAVVGNEQIAKSPEFVNLQRIHGRLVEALKVRPRAMRKIVDEAKFEAIGLTAELQDFFTKISARADDFQNPR